MLQGMRNASRSWLGKVVVGIMFSLLIVSFAIWGINDIFKGAPRTTVATVGKTEISTEQMRTAYQNDLQRLTRQSRRSITPDQARALGLDRQILGRLLVEASLDRKAADLGLHVSDQTVARTIMGDTNFRGPDGQFSRAAFDDILRQAGLSEAGFVREQRSVVTRLQLAEALSADLPVPLAAREAVHRYGAERRQAAYVILPAGAAGEIPAPSEAELQAFFDERKASFRAPEFRSLAFIALDPASLAKPDAVPEAEVRARYDQVKGGRFGTAERRTIQQIAFPDEAAAAAAAERLRGGTTFEEVAREQGTDETALALGTFARTELVDPAIGAAAFALAEGVVSEPVKGRFGPVLLRVTAIEPESVRPFESVAGELRQEIATERAKGQVEPLHDAVEDLRAGAKPLADIAREKGLPLVSIPAIDRNGRDAAGAAVEALPERELVLPAAFRSDIGVDNEALRGRAGGYVWYEVVKIDPPRDRSLAEVREAVGAQWREDAVARRLTETGRALVERLDKGEGVEALAGELGLSARTAADLARGTAKDDLPADVVNRIFAVPSGKAGTSPAGAGRAVFKVTGATVPPFVTTTQQAASLEAQLRVAFADDLLSEYIAEVQKGLGVQIYPDALRRAVGGEY